MKLEKKKDAEIAQRQGMTIKTIIQVIWLLVSGVISYFLVTYLLANEEVGFTYGSIYSALGISRSTVPEIVILGVLILIGVMLLQIFLWLGFMFGSPEGRRRTGEPTLHSRNYDPNDYR